MNANELADKLSDKTMRDYIVFEYLPEIVSTLRQQQESIAGLTRDYDLLFAEHQLLRKKEWVGLTDDEIYKIHTTLTNEIYANFKTFAHAIQSKLKDKNTRGQE